MERIPEPELMNGEQQALAYASADFEAPHAMFIDLFRQYFPDTDINGTVLDLGCGPGDITLRFAHAFPACSLHGIDAAPNMLKHGVQAALEQGLADRIDFLLGYLPGTELPQRQYDAVISNSLLHHLAEPAALWQAVNDYAKSGAPVFVMDLMRPESPEQAKALVQEYAAGEPEILREDFHHSLFAAYRPDEVTEQLQATGLDYLQVEVISDRHFTVSGRKK